MKSGCCGIYSAANIGYIDDVKEISFRIYCY
jgi:hypothetical protein